MTALCCDTEDEAGEEWWCRACATAALSECGWWLSPCVGEEARVEGGEAGGEARAAAEAVDMPGVCACAGPTRGG